MSNKDTNDFQESMSARRRNSAIMRNRKIQKGKL